MLEHLTDTLHNQCGLIPKQPIIAAVSGGPDSLCLMDILRKAGYGVVVAHFNHKLRPDADADANNVERMAGRLNLQWVIESGDVREFAATEKMSIEEASRVLRYRFLVRQAHRYNAQAIAVGHTADDQVETVLMHFIRGAGLAGLKGMTHRTILPMFDPEIPIVRPLLDLWREDTLVYCAVNGLRPRHDPSNDTLDFLRNRLRHLLIPTLETYNPRFRESVWRTAQSLNGDHELLANILDDAWKQTVTQQTADFIALDSTLLTEHRLGLQRNLIRRAISLLYSDGADLSFETLERAIAFIADPTNTRLNLANGIQILRDGGVIYLALKGSNLPFERWPQLEHDSIIVSIPCTIPFTGGWKLTCERWNMASLALAEAKTNEDPFQAWLDARNLTAPLELRPRKDGDRFAPLGMDGHDTKLSDFFVNAKLPQRARDRWPLLCMGDEVIWVPGHRIAHPFRLTENTRQVVYFSLTKG